MADRTPLPDHADLPVVEGAPPGSSWGLWGEGDRLGCLNLLTPERVVEAARLVQTGAVFPLDVASRRASTRRCSGVSRCSTR